MALQNAVVKLSDGRELILREPSMDDLEVFLRAFPSLTALIEAFSKMGDNIAGVPIVLPPGTMNNLYPLLAISSGVSEDELRGLSVFEGMALLAAFNQLFAGSAFLAPPENTSGG